MRGGVSGTGEVGEPGVAPSFGDVEAMSRSLGFLQVQEKVTQVGRTRGDLTVAV